VFLRFLNGANVVLYFCTSQFTPLVDHSTDNSVFLSTTHVPLLCSTNERIFLSYQNETLESPLNCILLLLTCNLDSRTAGSRYTRYIRHTRYTTAILPPCRYTRISKTSLRIYKDIMGCICFESKLRSITLKEHFPVRFAKSNKY